MKISLTIIFIGLTSILMGQKSINLTGTVVGNSNKKPIEGAIIEFFESGSEFKNTAHTDEKGSFTIRIKCEENMKYYFNTTKEGFHSVKQVRRIKNCTDNIILKFYLKEI